MAIDVTLCAGGAQVASTANDIIFDPAVADLGGISACRINPAISYASQACQDDPTSGPCKTLTKQIDVCPGPGSDPCPAGSQGKKRFRGIVLSTANQATIPGGRLYTCTFTIPAIATGHTDLAIAGTAASDPSGGHVDASGHSGRIDISSAGT